MGKKTRFIFCAMLVSVLFVSCEFAPENSVKNGVLVSEKSYNNEVDILKNSDNKKMSVREVLNSFPTHITREFKNGTNCLYMDADIVIPDIDTKIYQSKVALSPWSESEILTLTEMLRSKGLIEEDYPLETIDRTIDIPLVCVNYGNIELLIKDKAGNLKCEREDNLESNLKAFCEAFLEYGVQMKLIPQYGGRFSINPMYKGIPISTGFPTTGTERIVNEYLGGAVTFAENTVLEFSVNGKFEFSDEIECQRLLSFEKVENSIQTAVDTNEIVFSPNMKATKLSLEYLIIKEMEAIQMIPVWNIEFDINSYYSSKDESQNEEQGISMMNLCINAIDGSVVYAV